MSYPDATSNSAKLYERARAVMPGGNSRLTIFQSPYPIYVDHGMGCRVTDVDGVERLDFFPVARGRSAVCFASAAIEDGSTTLTLRARDLSPGDARRLLADAADRLAGSPP